MLKFQILGNSTIRRKLRILLAQGNLCKQQIQERNFENKDLPFSAEEVGNYRSMLNVLNGSIEDKCIDMGNVHGFIDESPHSSWTEFFGEPGSLQEHKLRGN